MANQEKEAGSELVNAGYYIPKTTVGLLEDLEKWDKEAGVKSNKSRIVARLIVEEWTKRFALKNSRTVAPVSNQ